METVTFVPEIRLRRQIAGAFALRAAQLERWLPFAEIEHIGSTAIPGALTKGDLDIQVRVAKGEFPVAEETLAGIFARNDGVPRSETFASFKDNGAKPPLGVQLVVRGSEWDVFSRFRDALTRDRRLVVEYNRIKERFQNGSMDEYRKSKEQFIDRVLAGTAG